VRDLEKTSLKMIEKKALTSTFKSTQGKHKIKQEQARKELYQKKETRSEHTYTKEE
jgi:hypothetical protein